MAERFDVAVIGAGPAGSAAAIRAARGGRKVLLLEAGHYPRDKVCGEFVSPEALALLRGLLASRAEPLDWQPAITHVRVFLHGKCLQAALDRPALAVPRLLLDSELWMAAKAAGAEVFDRTLATAIHAEKEGFAVETTAGRLAATAVIDATGRSSRLRFPIRHAGKRGAIGLKAHAQAEVCDHRLDLYFFCGGYCGVQPIGNRQVNVCCLVAPQRATSFGEVFDSCAELRARSADWAFCTQPVVTSGLVSEPGAPEANGILRAGDAAGFIDPFVGDGIALALHSGALAGQICCTAAKYASAYRERFAGVFRRAAAVRWMIGLPSWLQRAMCFAGGAQALLPMLVRQTRYRGGD
jgi:flavin-dependent dehydrogenase